MDAILKSHFLALYCMVLADGVVDSSELNTLYRIGTEDYGLTPDEIIEAVRVVGTSFIVPKSLDGKIKLLHDMATVAWADGEIDETETKLLKKYIERFGFQPENSSEIAAYLLDSVKAGRSAEDIIEEVTEL